MALPFAMQKTRLRFLGASVTGRDRRLDKVTEVLTAKERAILVLRAWKEKRYDDPAWRSSMPSVQASEFNRLIRLMTGVSIGLGPLVIHLEAQVEMLSLRLGWLTTFLMWQWNVEQLAEFIQFETPEVVTESEHNEREQKTREEYKPVAELAELLTERYEDWNADELEADQSDDPDDAVIVMPKAWERVEAEKVEEIASLVKHRTLDGRGKGSALKVQAGSFYDWLAEPVPVVPEWAKEYRVVSDGDNDALSGRWSRERARKAYRWGPTHPVVHLDGLDIDFGEPSKIDELVEVQRSFLRDGVCEQWRMLGAVEQVTVEAAEEFDGEDPAVPEMRQVLDHCKEKLTDLHEEVQKFTGPFELPPPTEDELSMVRETAERGA